MLQDNHAPYRKWKIGCFGARAYSSWNNRRPPCVQFTIYRENINNIRELLYWGAFGKGRPRSLASTVYRSWAGARLFTDFKQHRVHAGMANVWHPPLFHTYTYLYHAFLGGVARDASFPGVHCGAGTLVFFRLAQRSGLTGEWCCDDVQRAVVPDSLSQHGHDKR